MFFDLGGSKVEEKNQSKSSSTKKNISISNPDDNYRYISIEGDVDSKNKVLVINIKGLILTEAVGEVGLFQLLEEPYLSYGYEIKDKFYRAAKNSEIKAVMLEINSPGGTIGGAKAISEGINYYKQKTNNPVYSHVIDQGTSGAYWAAAATDQIISEVGSIIGSIGVIMGPFKTYNTVLSEGGFSGSVQTLEGIEYRYFTGGEYKDTGSPYRKMTEEEEEHWQSTINGEYNVFVNYISENRGLSPNFIKNTVKALPYGNQDALSLGLIDDIGGADYAMNKLIDAANMSKSDYEIIIEEKSLGIFDEIFGVIQNINKPQVSTQMQLCPICNKPLYLDTAGLIKVNK
jgi:protease-4